MNTPISFSNAKLIKEKAGTELFSGNMAGFIMNKPEVINLPTIAEVVMRLYEKHGIWVVVDNLIDNKFYFSHRDTKTNNYASRSGCNEEGYESPTEAYEAAIEYTFKNLIS